MDAVLRSVELPNVGDGPDPVSVCNLGADVEFLVLLLMQGARSSTCRQQVRDVADRYDDVRQLNAQIAAIVPGSPPQLRPWRWLVDPPFPVLADDEGVFETAFRQPRQYGLLGRFVDSFGRMPVTLVLECGDDGPSVCYRYDGATSVDRPPVGDLLDVIRAHR